MKKRVVWITAVVACLLLCFVLTGCAEQTAYENMGNNSQTQQGQTSRTDRTTEQTGQSGNGTQGQSQATPEPGNEQPGQSHDTTGQTQQDNQPSQPQTPAEDPAALDFNFEERAGGGYAVTSYKGTATRVTIPSTYKGKNVVTIGTSKMDGITRIADGMTNSYDVEEIIIPDTVRAIGFGAFAYCVSLKEIHIPNVAKVDGSAFLNCTNLTKITIDGGVLDINTFKGCERVKEIILGQNVTGIKSELFAECTSLERLTLPDIEANTFGALFKRVYFTYNGDLVPETTVAGKYSGGSVIYNKPASNTRWLMPTSTVVWQGETVIWDGEPAYSVSNYKTVTLYSNDTCSVPTTGTFYGYTIPQSLKAVTVTDNCDCVAKFKNCTTFNAVLPHTYATTWSSDATQHWHAATCGHDVKADAADHTWGAWVVTKAPTCTKTGTKQRACTVCGKTVSETIAVTQEHTFATTWTSDDTQHWHAATCGHDLTKDVADHEWGEWVVTKEPTCTQTGTKQRTCTVCGKTVSETIAVTQEHTFATTWTSDDTQHWHAATCGHDLKEDVANHTWSAWVTTQEPTCTQTGTRQHTCSVCGKTVSEDIAKIAHTYGDDGYCTACGDYKWLEFTLSGNGYTVFAKDPVGDLIIPSTYNGRPVTAIGASAFANRTTLQSVVIPDSVTSIGNSAFSGCTGLTSVTIPGGVTSINDYAFRGCIGLTSIAVDADNTVYHSAGNCLIKTASKTLILGCKTSIIPADGSVTSIGNSAFSGCTGLTSIIIPDSVTSIGSSAFSGCSSLVSITIPFVGGSRKKANSTYQYPFGYIFGTSSYKGGTAITQIYYGSSTSSTTSSTYYIPATLRSVTVTGGNILYGAFSNCTGLTSITIPDSVTDIGDWAFRNCTGLTSVTIPNSVTSIGGSAFDSCTGLTSVTIPNSVTSIGQYAFYNCTKLSYNVYGNAKYLGNAQNPYVALIKASDTLITSCTIHADTRVLYASAFSGCSSLVSMTIPFVGNHAGVTANDTYQYPFGYIFGTDRYTGGTAVEQYYYGSSTSSATNSTYYIPATLRSVTVTGGNILYGAFYNCSMLTSITILDSVTSIGNYSFYECKGLTSVTIPDSVTSIGNYSFYECKGLTSVTIPDSVTSIGRFAFYECRSLTSITLPFVGQNKDGTGKTHFGYIFGASDYSQNGTFVPASLKTVIMTDGTSIGNYSFYECKGLTSVTIPDSVTSIGNSAFSRCTGLTSITMPNSVTSIGGSAFYSCTGLTSVTIPNSVTSIGQYAFYGCTNLTSVTIPGSVTNINRCMFGTCYGLTRITFQGTKAEWNAISKESDWDAGIGGRVTIYCTDGNISI